jgi:hypothetical protein
MATITATPSASPRVVSAVRSAFARHCAKVT